MNRGTNFVMHVQGIEQFNWNMCQERQQWLCGSGLNYKGQGNTEVFLRK